MQIGDDAKPAAQTCCVFVLDDDETTRAALQFMLPGDSETHELASIDAALARGQQRRPDLVVVSEWLIARSSLVLLHQLRAAWPGVKCLVVCAAADDECHAAALAAGADDTLMRPFRIDSVRHTVDRLLGRQQDEARRSARVRLTQQASVADRVTRIGHH